MATKNDFTEPEWEGLQKGITGSGMLASLSDRDFTDTFGEAGAMAKYLSGQQVAGSSDFIRELAKTHGTGFGFTRPPTACAPRRWRRCGCLSPPSTQRPRRRSSRIASSSLALPRRSPMRRVARYPSRLRSSSRSARLSAPAELSHWRRVVWRLVTPAATAPAQALTASSPSPTNPYEAIDALAALRDKGAITPKFEAKKADLLSRL